MPSGRFNIYISLTSLANIVRERLGRGSISQGSSLKSAAASGLGLYLCVLCCCVFLQACGDMRTPNDCLISGNQYFALADYEHAAMDYREALKREPDKTQVAHKTALNNLGVVLSALGKHEEAVQVLKNAIELDPKNHISHYTLAQSLIALKQYKEALEQAKIAVELQPDELAAHKTLADAALAGGELELAISEYRHLIKGDADDDEAHQKLGEALFQSGDKEGGLAELKKAIELKPDSVEARISYARVLKETGDIADAEQQVDEALKHAPKDKDLLELKESLKEDQK